MRMVLIFLVLGSCAMILTGCFTVQKGTREFKTVDYGVYEQYAMNKIDKVELVAAPGSQGNKFCLEAIGSFTVHSGRRQASVDQGVPTMSIGIWPGYNCLQEESRTGYVACQVLLYWWNPFCWAGTFWSTFVTPFSDEYRDMTTDQVLALWSIFGCVKYIDRNSAQPAKTFFREESVRKEDRVRLYNYRLIYNDGEYYDDNGVVKFVGSFKRGQVLRVKLVSAPALRPDSDERIEDLVGVKIESSPLP